MNEKDIIKYAIASFLGTLIALVDYRTVRAALVEVAADEKMWVDVENRLGKHKSLKDVIMETFGNPPPAEKKNR